MLMKTVGVFEAKTHLSALLDEVERGETIVVTRKGRKIAKITSLREEDDFDEALRRVRNMHIRLGVPIKEAVEEGRR